MASLQKTSHQSSIPSSVMNARIADEYIGQIINNHRDPELAKQLSEIGGQMDDEPLDFGIAEDMDMDDSTSHGKGKHRSSIASGDTDTVINQLMSNADFNFLNVLTEMHSRKNSDALPVLTAKETDSDKEAKLMKIKSQN